MKRHQISRRKFVGSSAAMAVTFLPRHILGLGETKNNHVFRGASRSASPADIEKYSELLKKSFFQNYELSYREAGGPFKYPFFVAGSAAYNDVLWDWDSWLCDIGLRQILLELGSEKASKKTVQYEQGCVLNFLNWCGSDGWIPIMVQRNDRVDDCKPADIYSTNMHKPCLAQHAAFITKYQDGNAEWLRSKFDRLRVFVNNYISHHKHRCGLYFWQDDRAIGVDNDPCTFFRPKRSSGSIYLNCMMYKELAAIAYLAKCLGMDNAAAFYADNARKLKCVINENCWDPRDGFYYSVDLNLLPNNNISGLHSGMPRDWDCLIQRIGTWTGFMGLWAGIAEPQQAQRVVVEHYRNMSTFCAEYGVRSLSKMEKMYRIAATSNPSCWLGPVWGISNYMVFRGLVNYGFNDDAVELAHKTILLFGMDMERCGQLHEYYNGESGQPVMNRGFQNWNLLVLNMIAWLQNKPFIKEF